MLCPTKKGLNLRICGFGMLGQAFYSIMVPEEKENNTKKMFPRILTIREGFVNENMIDCKLKYLFKGRTGWTIKQIGDKEFILHFPSEELRHECDIPI
jgi:hypothetical protein